MSELDDLKKQITNQCESLDQYQSEQRKIMERLLLTEQEVTAKDNRIQELNNTIESLLNLKADVNRIIDEGYSRKYSELCKAINEEYEKVTASHRFDPVSAITRLKRMI